MNNGLGLPASLIFFCECGVDNELNTGKTHRNLKRGPQAFDINTKAAASMLHSGHGYTQVSDIFETLGVPAPSEHSMKKHEHEIGPCFENY